MVTMILRGKCKCGKEDCLLSKPVPVVVVSVFSVKKDEDQLMADKLISLTEPITEIRIEGERSLTCCASVVEIISAILHGVGGKITYDKEETEKNEFDDFEILDLRL
jgi:hypothetical protein